MRGTPILLQLFVLYYGLAAAIRLPAFAAALLGLALNYAAYESEIYRAALEAVPPGQLEAARTLGLSERQVLTLIRGPQAFRLALAPMTNDFIALLKDSSLVSVLTVMELTKQTQIFATNLGSWVIPGALCAALYLAMSLPLAALARRLERRWKARDAVTDAGPRSSATFICGAGAAADSARRQLRRSDRASWSPSWDRPAPARRPSFAPSPGSSRSRTGASRSRMCPSPPAIATARRCARLRRKIGMVFQFHCLFEHLSALDNVCLAPVHAHGVRRDEARAARARAAAGVRRRAPRRGAAARAVGRRGPARRDRARAGRRTRACC